MVIEALSYLYIRAIALTNYINLRPTEQRVTFTSGHYIRYRNNQLGQLQHIMLHELRGKKRLFAVILKVIPSAIGKDWVLKLPLLQATDERVVVGLSAMKGDKLYIVPSSMEGYGPTVLGGKNLLWIDWPIQFL